MASATRHQYSFPDVSAIFILLGLLLTFANAQYATLQTSSAESACPTTASDWASTTGTQGAIVDPSDGKGGSKNLLFAYGVGSPGYLGSYPGDVGQCQALCNAWPNFPNAPVGLYNLLPYNGVSGPCAYWAYDGKVAIGGSHGSFSNTPTCYLFSNGACQGTAFNKNSIQYSLPNYRCGKGPGATGGAKGDPHFTGAYNSHFDFTGEPNKTYCAISDAHLHINFYHGGRYIKSEDNTQKAATWIRQIGILWGHHTLVLAARSGASWQYLNGYMDKIEVDGEEVMLSQPGDWVEIPEAGLTIDWQSGKKVDGDDLVDVYTVRIAEVITMELTLRPEVAELRTAEDGIVHFDVSIPVLRITRSAHGVLGQTYRNDHKERLSSLALEYNDHLQVDMVKGENGEGFLDGGVADYQASNLLKADCQVARFARMQGIDTETAEALEISSGFAAGSHTTSKSGSRKMFPGSVATS